MLKTKSFDDKWTILVTVLVILVTKILLIVINITVTKFSNQLVIFIPVLIFSFAWFPWWPIENCWVIKTKIENKILIISQMENSGWWSGKRTSLLYVKGGSKIIFTLNINILSKSVTVKIPKITSNVTTDYIFFPFPHEEFPNLRLSPDMGLGTRHTVVKYNSSNPGYAKT